MLADNFYQPVFSPGHFPGSILPRAVHKTVSFRVPAQRSADRSYRNICLSSYLSTSKSFFAWTKYSRMVLAENVMFWSHSYQNIQYRDPCLNLGSFIATHCLFNNNWSSLRYLYWLSFTNRHQSGHLWMPYALQTTSVWDVKCLI